MTSIKRNKTLWDATAAGTGTAIALDSRYDKAPFRPIQGTVTTGDTIAIQGTTWDNRGPDKTGLSTAPWTTIKSYTADFNDVLTGDWTYLRVVKTGSTGSSKVYGFI